MLMPMPMAVPISMLMLVFTFRQRRRSKRAAEEVEVELRRLPGVQSFERQEVLSRRKRDGQELGQEDLRRSRRDLRKDRELAVRFGNTSGFM